MELNNRLTRRALFLLCLLGLAGVLALGYLKVGSGPGTVQADPNSANVIRARAIISGPPGSGIEGKVLFTQAPADENFPEPGVDVVARVEGLTPGLHGFHIHENGTCDPPTYQTAGGHFDPGPFGNSQPVDANHPYHMGDLPNLEANEGGVAHLSPSAYTTSRITLSPGPLTVFDANGSAVIVHANQDLGTPGVVGASGGPRVACGVIVLEEPAG
jgi:superoxide dismutase, Cu-Zn family